MEADVNKDMTKYPDKVGTNKEKPFFMDTS